MFAAFNALTRLTKRQLLPWGTHNGVARVVFIVAVVGSSAAGCSYSTTTTTVPAPAYCPGAEQACADYGFRVGTDSYNRCVSREAEARALGRAPVTYPIVNITNDAQTACYSYGLTPGSATFERCVNYEIDARRYREAVVVTPAQTIYPAPGTATYVT